jgi:hypothetical protein
VVAGNNLVLFSTPAPAPVNVGSWFMGQFVQLVAAQSDEQATCLDSATAYDSAAVYANAVMVTCWSSHPSTQQWLVSDASNGSVYLQTLADGDVSIGNRYVRMLVSPCACDKPR